MPSGPKKRRAAKRKKEMEEQMKAAPSPSDPPRDAGGGEDRVPHEGGEADSQSPTFSSAPIFPCAENQSPLSSRERFGSDAADSAGESSKNLKDEELVEEDESAAKSEKENSKPAEESAISVDSAIGLTERSQVTEFAARVLEETLADDTEKETQVPGADGVVNHDGDGHQVAGGDETSPATEVLEERNQVKEAAAEVLEGISGVDGEKEPQLPDIDVAVKHEGDGRQFAVGDETSPATEVLEERNQVKEAAAAEVLEGISGADGEKDPQLPDIDVAVKHEGDGRQAAVGDEALPATELLHRSTLVERRATWLNCCGLLDFVTNPDG
ncbi:uncharacterized protein LOC141838257 [Curcuma longa]|uniref:uncharacterized protein LOC141838257 n=1 Tax=Curcuma longa TaxID=136217 RepID=UPI003D9E6C63